MGVIGREQVSASCSERFSMAISLVIEMILFSVSETFCLLSCKSESVAGAGPIHKMMESSQAGFARHHRLLEAIVKSFSSSEECVRAPTPRVMLCRNAL